MMSSMAAARATSPRPGGVANDHDVPGTENPTSSSRSSSVSTEMPIAPATYGTGQAAHAADHQHGDQQEGQVEIETFHSKCPQEVAIKHACDARHETADDEGSKAFPDNPHA